MTIKKILTQNTALGILCAALWGCNVDQIPDLENTYLPEYKGSIALILGRDTVNVKEFLDELGEKANVQEGENLNLSIIYEDSTDFEVRSDLVKVESFSNSKQIYSPIDQQMTMPKDTTIVIEQNIAFNFPASKGEILDSTYYMSGYFVLSLQSTFQSDVDYIAVSSSFQEVSSQRELTIVSTAVYNSGNGYAFDENAVGLNGYKTLLQSSADSNKFELAISATITIPEGTFLSGREYLYFDLQIEDPEFSAIFGDFGKDTFDIKKQEIELDIFEKFGKSGLTFQAPTITFDFENSFGVPVGLDFSQVYASFTDKEPEYLTGEITMSPQGVTAPDVQDYGSVTTSSIHLGPENSNLTELLASTPDQLVLALQGYSNYFGETENFLLDTSSIRINSTVHLPLTVQMNKFTYESEFEIDDLSDLEGTEEIALVFNTENELPFQGEVDLYFVDETGTEFDSLLSNVLFLSPESFDANGKVAEPMVNTSTVTLDAQKIESLLAATELRVVTRLYSHGYENDEYIDIYSDYSMIITLSVSGKVSVDLN